MPKVSGREWERRGRATETAAEHSRTGQTSRAKGPGQSGHVNAKQKDQTKPNRTEPKPNPVQHSTAQQSTQASPPNWAEATHPATCAIAMGMLLFTAFKLVEREIKKPKQEQKQQQEEKEKEEAQEVGLLLFPLVGRLPLSSICSFLPNRLFVGWLSYVLCVPLCKILYHTASRLSFAMAPAPAPARADQTKPDRTGTMSLHYTLCLRYLWLPRSKRMKPQNGHVVRCPCCPRRRAPLSVRSTVSNVAWRRHRLTLLIVVLLFLRLLLLVVVAVVVRRRVDIVAVVNSTASGHAALLFNSNNNFWFVSLHF